MFEKEEPKKECDIHVWEPKLVLNTLLYIRECMFCGMWALRDKTENGEHF